MTPTSDARPGLEGVSLRVVTYNLRDLLDDRDAAAHVLRSLRCDVACLQEVPRRWFRASQVRRLARESGLRWVCGGRRSGGTAVFVSRRVDVGSVEAFRLPVRGLLTRRRGAALVTAAVQGVRVTAVSVHLPLRPDERVTHARIIRAVVARGDDVPRTPTSVVIAGDLNEPPGGPAWRTISAGLDDVGAAGEAPTFPARRPRQRIDAVLVGPGVVVAGVRVPGSGQGRLPGDLREGDLTAASDHLPVVVDLLLPSRPEPS